MSDYRDDPEWQDARRRYCEPSTPEDSWEKFMRRIHAAFAMYAAELRAETGK